MTNNFDNGEHDHEHNDDFNEHEIGAPEQSRGMGGNLAEAWRSRPMFKFMVLIVAVFAVLVAGFNFLGGNNAGTEAARLGHAPTMHEVGGGTVTPNMRKQIELANNERADQAIQSGGSAIITPIGQNADVGGFGGPEKKDDALNELRAETERLKQQVQQQQVVQQQQQTQQAQQAKPPEQFDNSLAEAMQNQMRQLLESWKPKGITAVEVIHASDLKAAQDKAGSVASTPASGTVLASGTNDQSKILVNAGTVSYAQLLTEANSDVPGPILAQIVSGPLAGARAVGTFQVSAGYEKYLVLKFALADKKGKDYSIDAIALDPNTTLGGMATEVDERYFVRVVLPAAAGFLQGMGQALGQGNSSVTSDGTTTVTTVASNGYKQGIYNGMGQAANTMGQFFQNQANLTKPLVRVAAGTPIGMFFIAPVLEPNGTSGNLAAQQQGAAAMGAGNGYGNGYGNTGATQAGYPGTTVNGYGGANGANAASGMPYPNYGTPSYGYGGSTINRGPQSTGYSGASSYGQGYGQ